MERFYENIDEWAFQTEMFFLCNRYKQLKDVQTLYLSEGHSVTADYNILKNTIFARQTLPKSELEKYLKIYQIVTEDLPKSSLIIYMNASVDTIMQRIVKRGRSFERHIHPSYIEELRERYESFFETFQKRFPEKPCLAVDGDKLDFIENKEDLELILQQVGQLL